jgi:hypothetical protein
MNDDLSNYTRSRFVCNERHEMSQRQLPQVFEKLDQDEKTRSETLYEHQSLCVISTWSPSATMRRFMPRFNLNRRLASHFFSWRAVSWLMAKQHTSRKSLNRRLHGMSFPAQMLSPTPCRFPPKCEKRYRLMSKARCEVWM